jgi:hypothetical protein
MRSEMDKTLLRRIIAREWLILIGTIAITLIVMKMFVMVKNNMNYREYQKQLSQFEKKQTEDQKKGKYEKDAKGDTIDQIFNSGPTIPDKLELTSFDWPIVIFPYIIIQFIRSIIWAIKTSILKKRL